MPLALLDAIYKDIDDMYRNSEKELKAETFQLYRHIKNASRCLTYGLDDNENYELSNMEDFVRDEISKEREYLIDSIAQHMSTGIPMSYARMAARFLHIRQMAAIAYRYTETALKVRMHQFDFIDKRCNSIVKLITRKASGVPMNEKRFRKQCRRVEKISGQSIVVSDKLEEDDRIANAAILLSERIFNINLD